MMNAIEIVQMPGEEKFRAMGAPWTDVSVNDLEVDSPAWHREALEETKVAVMAGEAVFEDWEIAKQRLRNRL